MAKRSKLRNGGHEAMTREDDRRRRREQLRGHAAFQIAILPGYEDTPLDALLRLVDAVLVRFVLVERAR